MDLDDLVSPNANRLASATADDVPAWGQVSADVFHAAVAGLEPGVREVFRLRIVDRLSYDAIARTIGIPVATVGARLVRARARIRHTLLARLAVDAADRHQGERKREPKDARA